MEVLVVFQIFTLIWPGILNVINICWNHKWKKKLIDGNV